MPSQVYQQLRPEAQPQCRPAYREQHDALWPEMRQALLNHGTVDSEIYYHEDKRLLFAHVMSSGSFDPARPEAPAVTRA